MHEGRIFGFAEPTSLFQMATIRGHSGHGFSPGIAMTAPPLGRGTTAGSVANGRSLSTGGAEEEVGWGRCDMRIFAS